MKYTFNDLLTSEIYEQSLVLFVLGKYQLFNNMVCDEMKAMCLEEEQETNLETELSKEFSIEDKESLSTSVDFNTFLEVVGVQNVNGKWFCRVALESLTSKQIDKLKEYAKNPSSNGILVVSSDDWMVYKDILRYKVLDYSKVSNVFQLAFPGREVLKEIVRQMFNDKGVEIEQSAIDYFILKMSRAYDEYETTIETIVDMHKESNDSILRAIQIKKYMKGIEYYILDDFINELIKPLNNPSKPNKKTLRVMTMLEYELGAKDLLYKTLNIIKESIQYRIDINKGLIPIGIKFFYKDILRGLGGEEGPYGKVKEYTFRKKAYLASRTTLQDWTYMYLILNRAIENPKITDKEMEFKCKRALYEICTRATLTKSRLDNIIGIENILDKEIEDIDKIKYDEKELRRLHKNANSNKEDKQSAKTTASIKSN